MAGRSISNTEDDIRIKELSDEEKAFIDYASRGFGDVFYNSTIAMTVLSSDGLRCIEVNNAFLDLFECSREDVIRSSFLKLNLYSDSDHHSRILKLLENRDSLKNHEIKARTKTGKPLALLISLSRIRFGDIEYLIGSSVDITERKRAEEALRENARVSTAILNASSESMTLIDLSGMVLATNIAAAQRFGTQPSEMVGRCIYDFLPPDLAKSRKAYSEQVIRTGKPLVFEDERAGISFEIMKYPVHDEAGRVTGIVIYANDVYRV